MFSLCILAEFLLLMLFKSPSLSETWEFPHTQKESCSSLVKLILWLPPSLCPHSAVYSSVPWSMYSLINYLLCTYCVPGTMLSPSNTAGNK